VTDGSTGIQEVIMTVMRNYGGTADVVASLVPET
jgi:hypothetical protein